MSAPWPVHRGVMHRKVFDREHVVSDCVCFIVGGKLLVLVELSCKMISDEFIVIFTFIFFQCVKLVLPMGINDSRIPLKRYAYALHNTVWNWVDYWTGDRKFRNLLIKVIKLGIWRIIEIRLREHKNRFALSLIKKRRCWIDIRKKSVIYWHDSRKSFVIRSK